MKRNIHFSKLLTSILEKFTEKDLKRYSQRINQILKKSLPYTMLFLLISCSALDKLTDSTYKSSKNLPKDWTGHFDNQTIIPEYCYSQCQEVERVYYLSELLTLSKTDSVTQLQYQNQKLYVNYVDQNKASHCKVFEAKQKFGKTEIVLYFDTILFPPLFYTYEKNKVILKLTSTDDLIVTDFGDNFGGIFIISGGRNYKKSYIFKKVNL